MESLYLLIPVSALLVLAIIGVFAWALHGGQFDDLDAVAERILADDASAPAAEQALAPAAEQALALDAEQALALDAEQALALDAEQALALDADQGAPGR